MNVPMKQMQIALLVLAGALGGAGVMRVWQRPQATEPPPASPDCQAPTAAAASTAPPVSETEPAPPPAEPPPSIVSAPEIKPEPPRHPAVKATRKAAPRRTPPIVA